MAEATRDRVRSAIDELGFIRNESARRLRQGAPGHHESVERMPVSQVLGLVLEDLSNPYFSDVARGAETAFHEAGVDAIWTTSDGVPGKEERGLELLAAQGVPGLLIQPVAVTAERIAMLREHGMSVVLIDEEMPGCCSVRVDHRAGGDIAVTHLLKRDPRRIAFVTGNPGLPGSRAVRDRMFGAAEAMERADLEKPAIISESGMTPTGGRSAAQRLVAMDPVPDAVFCANDLMAIGLVNELLRVEVRVPDEIAVVGYDDIELAGTSLLPLTTISQPRQELGEAAARLLLAEVAAFPRSGAAGEHEHQQIVLSPELVIRETG